MFNFKFRCELVGHKKDVRTISCPRNELIISGSRDMMVRMWSLSEEGCDAQSEGVLHGHENYVAALACHENLSPESSTIFTGSNDKKIRAYSYSGAGDYEQPAYILEGHEDTVCTLATDGRGALVSGSWDKSVRIWLDQKCALVITGHELAVWCVLLMPTSCHSQANDTDLLIVSGSADRTLRLWHARNIHNSTQQAAKEYSLIHTFHGHADCVRSLARIDDSRILSASNDASIRAWHIPTGLCIGEFYGHTSFIYCVATLPDCPIFASSGEDRCVRVWSLPSPEEWGTGKQFAAIQSIPLPCQSVWCLALTPARDIVVGGSDSLIRVFSADPKRQATDDGIKTYEASLASSQITVADAAATGDLDPSKLPGMEALLQPGKREGHVIVIKQEGRSVCYQWSSAETRWIEIGDVVGTGQSKLPVYNGREYDFVFSVDITDNAQPLKLPYNRTEDPWVVAQRFLHEHDLPQDYLETVAKFIITNAGPQLGSAGVGTNESTFVDPFTGADRYVPDRQSTISTTIPAPIESPFPSDTFIYLKNISLGPLLSKLELFDKESTTQLSSEVWDGLRSFTFDMSEADVMKLCNPILSALSSWSADKIFPLLDLLRCFVTWSGVSRLIFTDSNWNCLYGKSLGHPELPATNCMLILRLLANALASDGLEFLTATPPPTTTPSSLKHIIVMIKQLESLTRGMQINFGKQKQLQIALSIFIHNMSVLAHRSTSAHITLFPQLRIIPSLCLRLSVQLLSLAPNLGPSGVAQFHPEAVQTLFLTLGTTLLTVTSQSDKDDTIKLKRISLLACAAGSDEQAEHEIEAWVKVRQMVTYWSDSQTCSTKIRQVAAALLQLVE